MLISVTGKHQAIIPSKISIHELMRMRGKRFGEFSPSVKKTRFFFCIKMWVHGYWVVRAGMHLIVHFIAISLALGLWLQYTEQDFLKLWLQLIRTEWVKIWKNFLGQD